MNGTNLFGGPVKPFPLGLFFNSNSSADNLEQIVPKNRKNRSIYLARSQQMNCY